LFALVAAAWGLDKARGSVITDGVHAGPIKLGGLSLDAARRRLANISAAGEHRTIVLLARGRRLSVVPARVGIALDVDRMAAQALTLDRGGGFISRDLRLLTGSSSHAAVQPELTADSSAAVRRLAGRLDRPALNAAVLPTPDDVRLVRGRSGIEVQPAALGAALAAALVSRSRSVIVPARRVRATVTVAALRRRFPAYITIDRGRFTLRVYRHLRPARSYPIAVGMQGLQTPAGLYHIQNKVVNPAWDVPNSPWAGSLAGQTIPPGPADPLKARWMGLWNGAGIHGTDETDSIGHAFSHGCVRMLIPDVIDLYNRVRVGTPVYIGD
jgi:lipoprotein-anchoring transpeptidase ErfK/SrfK